MLNAISLVNWTT